MRAALTLDSSVPLPGKLQEEAKRLALSEEQKTYLVRLLACHQSSADVTQEMRSVFEVTVSRQLQQRYDPTTINGENLREDLKTLFWQTRHDYLARCRRYGVADQTVRLARLNEIFHRFLAAGNLRAAADILKQAAEETGGKYTNTQNHNLKGTARENLAAALGVSVEDLPEGRSEGH